jgi:hypothetical protein
MSAKDNNGKRSKMITPDKIAVIICGWENQVSTDVAQACAKRGYKVRPFGLATADAKDTKVDIKGVGQINLVKFGDATAKTKLQEAIAQAQKEDMFPVVVDTTGVAENVNVYNELKVPFVLQSQGGESHLQAVKDTEEAKTFALISEQMNKKMAAFDQMWQDWSKRYPGLFDDHDFFFKTNRPSDTPKSLLDSFSDLANKNFGVEKIQTFGKGEEKNLGFTEGYASREYTFKNGSGSSTFTFRQSVNDAQEYAESVADSVGFLAQKAQEIARPQVYNILDVASEPRKLLW